MMDTLDLGPVLEDDCQHALQPRGQEIHATHARKWSDRVKVTKAKNTFIQLEDDRASTQDSPYLVR